MRIAITASSGQLARLIIKELKKHTSNQELIGIARSPEKAKDLGIEIRKADYNDKISFEKALKGIEVLLIVSGNDLPEKRIIQHKNIIDSAKKTGVRKIVYTSIFGKKSESYFTKVINSNRQTEQDIKNSGMQWSIGRNGLYIDADIASIEEYKKLGFLTNSAGEGKCAYTSREELAFGYTKLLLDDTFNGNIYNLCAEAISQQELTENINEIFQTNIQYKAISVKDYIEDRKNVYDEFFGQIIGGIYECISNGSFDILSDFEKISGRKHLSAKQMLINSKTKS